MIRRPPRSTLFPYTPALPISVFRANLVEIGGVWQPAAQSPRVERQLHVAPAEDGVLLQPLVAPPAAGLDRKSTRLNSSHANISYAVFCLKKKNTVYCHS